MTTIHTTSARRALFVAFELSLNKWLLGFATQAAEKPRLRNVKARNLDKVLEEIAKAKKRFGLAEDAPVYSCYEAGRDGFWLHRYLLEHGIQNEVVDSASIEINRRAKRAKTDPLDATKLVHLLIRYYGGERRVWSVVRVPSEEAEDRRHSHRGLKDLIKQRTKCSNCIKALLFSLGIEARVDEHFREELKALRDWKGDRVPAGMQMRLLEEYAVWELLHRQIGELQGEQLRQLDSGKGKHLDQMRTLMGLKGIGKRGAWVLVMELFSWREIKNGKQLGALVGLTPVPYRSGKGDRELGLSKAGNCYVRSLLVELSWLWLRYQPDSKLSRWYQERFGEGNRRMRKIGIGALARKLLIALWRLADQGQWPEGAKEKDWRVALR